MIIMDSLKKTLPSVSEITQNVERLFLLENAVVNYGGGLVQLEQRARTQAIILKESSPEIALLLADIANYLHDVAICGKLYDSILGKHHG